MQKILPPLKTIHCSRWFYCFLFLHLLLWIIFPLLIRTTVPHDTVEGLAWGWQWQLGYSKHPSLAPWLTALSVDIFGSVAFGCYFIAELAVVVAFWAIWRLANKITTPINALIAVFSLEGIIYYTFSATKFTPDTAQTPVWALIMLVFYIAITDQRTRWWLLLGFLGGLALWAKYQAPLIFVTLFIFMLVTAQGRALFNTRKPYLALLILFIVFFPHLIWAYQHNFSEVHYALDSTTGNPSITTPGFFANHIVTPINMMIDQLLACIAFFIMLIPFYFGAREKQTHNSFDRLYVTFIALGPMFLTLLYSFVTGSYLIHRWCMPYFSALGLWAIIMLRPKVTYKKFKAFFILFFLIAILTLCGRFLWISYIAPHWLNDTHTDSSYPAQKIADYVTHYWQQHYHRKLKYIAASHYLAAYIAVYSKDKPTPFMGFSLQQSPWINLQKLKRAGTMIAWEIYFPKQKYAIPSIAKAKFPNAIILPEQHFEKIIKGVKVSVPIGIAVLPPQNG